jgi:hypothetical protein
LVADRHRVRRSSSMTGQYAAVDELQTRQDRARGRRSPGAAGSSPWQALAWCGGILAVSIALAAMLFRRRTR